MKTLYTLLFLAVSNTFMTLAWYGHLKFTDMKWFQHAGIFAIIFISWGIAFFEYCFQVPANRIGYQGNGGPFSLFQLKIVQEVISICVFVVFSLLFFKNEQFRWNHFVAFLCIILAVYFAYKK